MSNNPLTRGLEPQEVADIHFRAIKEGNHKLFVSTLMDDLQEMVGTSYSSPDMWWRAGLRMRDIYGVYYEFLTVREMGPSQVTLVYQAKTSGGTSRGTPVPIVLVKEATGWRVKQASY